MPPQFLWSLKAELSKQMTPAQMVSCWRVLDTLNVGAINYDQFERYMPTPWPCAVRLLIGLSTGMGGCPRTLSLALRARVAGAARSRSGLWELYMTKFFLNEKLDVPNFFSGFAPTPGKEVPFEPDAVRPPTRRRLLGHSRARPVVRADTGVRCRGREPRGDGSTHPPCAVVL